VAVVHLAQVAQGYVVGKLTGGVLVDLHGAFLRSWVDGGLPTGGP
jgi:hypothetical protein